MYHIAKKQVFAPNKLDFFLMIYQLILKTQIQKSIKKINTEELENLYYEYRTNLCYVVWSS